MDTSNIEINFLARRIKSSEEALKLFARYDKLIEDINAFKKKYFNDWTVNVPKIIEQKTKNVILSRHGSDLVLNFSPMVRIVIEINFLCISQYFTIFISDKNDLTSDFGHSKRGTPFTK